MTRIRKCVLQVAITSNDTVPFQSPYIPIAPDDIEDEGYRWLFKY